MDPLLVVALLLSAALLLAFVLAPLFRDEEDFESFDRPRPGTRTLHGPRPEQTQQVDWRLPERGETYCSNCGAIIETEYNYCGECLSRVQ